MFFGYCSVKLYAECCTPQEIVLEETVAGRLQLSEKAMARAMAIVDGKVDDVDWDVRESSHPIVRTKKFGCFTGRSQRVETSSSDDVFYARVERRGAPIWGRFVRGRKGEMSRSQTVILRPVSDAGPVGWRVVAAYVGEPSRAFPGDPFADARSVDFWSSRALVDGTMPYDETSITTDCPW